MTPIDAVLGAILGPLIEAGTDWDADDEGEIASVRVPIVGAGIFRVTVCRLPDKWEPQE